jgi:hypothetical protein
MKIVKTLFLIGGLSVLLASCGAHKGGTCPAYKTDTGASIDPDKVAENHVDLTKDAS